MRAVGVEKGSGRNEVEGMQGAGPKICIGGAGSPKSPDHVDSPPSVLPPALSPLPTLTNLKIND
jgi:hypothetical protein